MRCLILIPIRKPPTAELNERGFFALRSNEMLDRRVYFNGGCRETIMNTQDNYETIRVRKDFIPNGAKLVEAYETATEIIVCGDPPDEPEGLTDAEYREWYENSHNCDAMGCATLSHVIYRFTKAV